VKKAVILAVALSFLIWPAFRTEAGEESAIGGHRQLWVDKSPSQSAKAEGHGAAGNKGGGGSTSGNGEKNPPMAEKMAINKGFQTQGYERGTWRSESMRIEAPEGRVGGLSGGGRNALHPEN
jgi:hypothetical protein